MAHGTVRQRSKVRKDSWTVQVYMGVDSKTGKKHYHSEAVRGTKALAQRRLTELLRQIDLGTFKEPSHVTVGEYLGQWLTNSVKGRVSNRTLQSYRGNLDHYLIPKLGKYPLEKLTAKQVEQMESELLQGGGHNGRPCRPELAFNFTEVSLRRSTMH